MTIDLYNIKMNIYKFNKIISKMIRNIINQKIFLSNEKLLL